jgi:hypothetical protein
VKIVQPEFAKIATTSVVLSMLLFWLIELIFHVPLQLMFLKTGLVVTLVSLFWVAFEKWAWRWRWVRKTSYFALPPDLNGRWEGKLQRAGEPDPHAFVLEIVQTYSHIKLNGYSRHSSSHCQSAAILTDEVTSHFILIFSWVCTTANTTPAGTTLEFPGTSVIEVSRGQPDSRDNYELRDSYYTGRNPQTRGTVHLRRVGNVLYNRFAKQ